jgi:hypothetical protein
VRGTKELNWNQTPFSSGPFGLDAKIKMEIEMNEGGTVWCSHVSWPVLGIFLVGA